FTMAARCSPLFLELHRTHRLLRSFPTRRSSDLSGMAAAWTVVLSMGLLNVLGTLQNVESAEAAGDAYPAASALTTFCSVPRTLRDRKSTRLNSSHVEISYAVFCLKKKKKTIDHR